MNGRWSVVSARGGIRETVIQCFRCTGKGFIFTNICKYIICVRNAESENIVRIAETLQQFDPYLVMMAFFVM